MSEQHGPRGEQHDGPSWAGPGVPGAGATEATGPSDASDPSGAPPQQPGGTGHGASAQGSTAAAALPRQAAAEPHVPAPEPPGSGTAAEEPYESSLARGIARVTGTALAPYQTAIVRIGFAATWLLFLLREWPHRHELYGPDGPWSWDLADKLIDSNQAFTVLLWSDGTVWFELVYALAVLSSVALLVGWRSRTSSVLFMIGVLSLQNRSVFMGDGGDNVIHLMAMYLVLTRCGRVWSLDARRARRRAAAGAENAGTAGAGTPPDAAGAVLWAVFGAVLAGATLLGGLSTGWALFFWALWAAHAVWGLLGRYAPRGEARTVCDMLANLAHNAALLVMVVEVCLIYSTAGWYKIQGSRWQDGTAVYYPMNLDYFSPWPELSAVLAGSGLLTLLITYGTVAVQVAFPFALFNRRVKNVLLAAMITEHVSIAVLLGLPFFSMAMVAADAIFLPTVALLWLGRQSDALRHRLPWVRRRAGEGSGRGPGDVPEGGEPSALPRQRDGADVSVR